MSKTLNNYLSPLTFRHSVVSLFWKKLSTLSFLREQMAVSFHVISAGGGPPAGWHWQATLLIFATGSRPYDASIYISPFPPRFCLLQADDCLLVTTSQPLVIVFVFPSPFYLIVLSVFAGFRSAENN